MRILVTNDDSIHAPGLKIAEKIARALSDDVWVVAPESDQSGVSHSLSLNDPLRLRTISDRHFAVKGTPADCVIMGVRSILADKKPDLIISGVNRGQNIAEDIIYSGTVAGAMEGAILGIPAVALSQCYNPATRNNPPWDAAETLGPDVVRKIIPEIPAGGLVNINFPALPPGEIKGVMPAAQGRRSQDLLTVEQRNDGRGLPYYWLTFIREKPTVFHGTDNWAIGEGYISVTPLKIDLTDQVSLTRLAGLFHP
jgi:5'-nucleotidase